MNIVYVPSNILSAILCMTDDATIYSLASSCKTMNQLLNIHRKEITWAKYNVDDYNLYQSIPFSCFRANEENKNKRTIDISNMLSLKTDTHKMSMHLFTLMLLHRTEVEKPYDIIASIKLKGDVSCVVLTVGENIHMQFSIEEYIKSKILSEDVNGYIEILTPFLDYIPVCCLGNNNAFMSLQSHGGDVIVEISYVKLKEELLLPKTACVRTPITFFSKTFEEAIPNKMTIPMSCTWNDIYACFCFDIPMSNVLERIELVDSTNTTVFCIASQRLEACFLQQQTEIHHWMTSIGGTQCKKDTKYIVPLSGHGGMYNVVFWLKQPTYPNLSITGARWHMNCTEFQDPFQE